MIQTIRRSIALQDLCLGGQNHLALQADRVMAKTSILLTKAKSLLK